MNLERFNEFGFEVIENVFEQSEIDYLIAKLAQIELKKEAKQRKSVAFGIRNLLNVSTAVKNFSESKSIRKLVEPSAGKNAKVIRAIFFDKTPEANWKVPFHQDITIAVKERKNVEDFDVWTKKASILHVQPPASVLENITTLRVHLDDTDESNGALKVVEGSHRFGRLSASEIENQKLNGKIAVCSVKKGGAMLMRPLLLHASSAAENARHRRVVHLEFSSLNLPGGLEWFGS